MLIFRNSLDQVREDVSTCDGMVMVNWRRHPHITQEAAMSTNEVPSNDAISDGTIKNVDFNLEAGGHPRLG